ncbi:hypothetical protein RhiirA5_422347 [Rhizophagus irregularis]|uniref:Uncharacterized protein n=1 Tax=Rhizophagus irregularis TaxID=588596 RepID=A0A2N0PC24_9GLOM|nr:hypothetical protein RhiirA5_422347 [Rhizophagus irregularis]
MPAKISTMCYIQRLTQEFTVKEIMAVARLNDDDPTKILYLRVNAMSVKLIDNMEFDDIPAIGDWEPREFWVEVRHNVTSDISLTRLIL